MDKKGRVLPGRAFQKRSEGKGNQQNLQPPVGGDGAHKIFDHFKLTAFDGDIKQE